jgi:hypothetical protein
MKHRIAQEHHMEEENEDEEEEYITEYIENEEIKHLVDRNMLPDCCMKTTLTKYINYLVYIPLTYIETLVLCVYQFILMLTLLAIITKYNIVEGILTRVLVDIISETFIGLCSMVINAMIIMKLFEDIWQVIFAFLCKCD